MRQFSKIVSVVIVSSFLFSSLCPNYLEAGYLRAPNSNSTNLGDLVSQILVNGVEGHYPILDTRQLPGGYVEQILGPLAVIKLKEKIGREKEVETQDVEYAIVTKENSALGLVKKSRDGNLMQVLSETNSSLLLGYLKIVASMPEKKVTGWEKLLPGGAAVRSTKETLTGDWGREIPLINFGYTPFVESDIDLQKIEELKGKSESIKMLREMLEEELQSADLDSVNPEILKTGLIAVCNKIIHTSDLEFLNKFYSAISDVDKGKLNAASRKLFDKVKNQAADNNSPDEIEIKRVNRALLKAVVLLNILKNSSNECINCKLCEQICPDKAMLLQGKNILGADSRYCKGCGLCVEECPEKVKASRMKVKDRSKKFRTSGIPMINRIEVRGENIGLLKELWLNQGKVLPVEEDVWQIELASEDKGKSNLLATFIKQGKDRWSLIVQPQRTIVICGLSEKNNALAQKIRKAGYKVIQKQEPELTKLLKTPDGDEVSLIVSTEEININKQQEFFGNYQLFCVYPGGTIDSEDEVFNKVLAEFIKIDKKEKTPAPGHGMCPACSAPTISATVLAVAEEMGLDPIAALQTGCHEVSTTPFPRSAWKRAIHVAFENLGAVLTGLSVGIKAAGEKYKNVVAIGFAGDGGTYDIGIQSLLGMLKRRAAALYVCYDNQAYMNTGVQSSGATFPGAGTTTDTRGKMAPRERLEEIIKAYGANVYFATVSPSDIPDFRRKVKKALTYVQAGKPAVLLAYSSCPLGHGFGQSPELSLKIADLAVESSVWPLFEYENGFLRLTHTPIKKIEVKEWMKPQGRFKNFIADPKNVLGSQKNIDQIWDKIQNESKITRQREELAKLIIEEKKRTEVIKEEDEKKLLLDLVSEINADLLNLYSLSKAYQEDGDNQKAEAKKKIFLEKGRELVNKIEEDKKTTEKSAIKPEMKVEKKKEKSSLSIDPAIVSHNLKQLKGERIGITWHGRGGQGAVTTSEILAEVSRFLGLFPEQLPQFSADRQGSPVKVFNKSEGKPIRDHSALTETDISIVLDATLMENEGYLQGLNEDGVLIVNTNLTPQEVREKYKIQGRKIYTVNATQISLDVFKKDKFVNTPMLGALFPVLEDHFGLKLSENFIGFIEERFAYRYQSAGGKSNRQAVEKAYQTVQKETALVKWKENVSIPEIKESEVKKIIAELSSQEVEVYSGNQATAEAMKVLSKIIGLAGFTYPITPSTSVIEYLEKFAAQGENITTTNMESEHSVKSAMIAASQLKKVLPVTATSSQGLAYMHELLPIAAMTNSPLLMAVACRALSGNIDIHGELGDIMPEKDSAGYTILFARNPQEAYDKTILGGLIALKASHPVIVAYIGFETSHAKTLVRTMSEEKIKELYGRVKIPENRPNLLDNDLTVGPFDPNPEAYFGHRLQLSRKIEYHLPKVIEGIENEFAKIIGRGYHSVSEYRLDDAEVVLVCPSISTAETVEEAIDELRGKGIKAGLLDIGTFRPFPSKAIREKLKGKKVVVTLDRSDSLGGPAGPVFTEVSTVLTGLNDQERPELLSYIMGLGGQNISIEDIKQIYEDMLLVESMKVSKDGANRKIVKQVIKESRQIEFLIGELVNNYIKMLEVFDPSILNDKKLVEGLMAEYKKELLNYLEAMDYVGFLGLRNYRGVPEEYNAIAKKRELLQILELKRANIFLEKADNVNKGHDKLINEFFANLDSAKLISIAAGLMFIAGAMFNPELRNNLLQILGLVGSGAIGMFVYKDGGLKRGVFANKNLFNKLSFISL